MFASLREKFYNVQEEITSSLRNLKLDRQISRDGRRKGDELCNYDAGLELLERYQNYWTDIHAKTEITALCAAEVDEIIQSVHTNYERQWEKVAKLTTTLALIPQVIHGVQEVCDTILNLQCAFDETEDALLMLEDMIETQELREKQLDHRFQLALYQEKRMSELDDLKDKLTDEHLRKMKEFEKKRAPVLKERQAVFQEAFEKDVQNYKQQGTVPSKTDLNSNIRTTQSQNTLLEHMVLILTIEIPVPASDSTPSLEEIQLDEDPFELETFLADVDRTDEADHEASAITNNKVIDDSTEENGNEGNV